MSDFCHLLDWDSAFFGKRIARLDGSRLSPDITHQVLEWCQSNRVDCLYFLADADDPQTTRLAEANGFQLVDVRVTLDISLDLAKPMPDNAGMRLRPAQGGDLPDLRQIARRGFTQSRFYFDTHFNPVDADRLYETWIEKSYNGYASEVLVAAENGSVQGFITCDINDTTGSIGLVGVAEAARGRGVGVGLVQGALAWFASQKITKVEVVTQGRNIAAQRLYQRCGFRTCSMELWYHRWFILSMPKQAFI